MSVSSLFLGWLPGKLKIWQKLTLACLAFGLPITVLLAVLLRQQNKDIQFARKELTGTAFLRPVRNLLGAALTHGILSARPEPHDAKTRVDLVDAATVVEKELKTLETLDRQHGAQLSQSDRSTTGLIQALQESWDTLKAGQKKKPEDRTAATVALVGHARNLIALVGDTSNLILDPDLDSYYLMDSVLLKLPEIVDLIGSLTAQGAAVSDGKSHTLNETTKDDLLIRRASLQTLLTALNSNTAGMPTAFRNDSTPDKSLESTLRAPLGAAMESGTDFAAQFDKKIVKAEEANFQASDVAQGLSALSASLGLWDQAVGQLDVLLQRRISSFEQARLYGLLGVAVALIVALLLVVTILLGITRQISALNEVFEKVQAGEYNVRAAVRTQDELGTAATSLNTMLDNTLTLIQSRDEKDEIQRSITKLLEEVAGVADGDLTKEAEVTADMTGAIADSFNYMLAQLRKIISNVKSATHQVSASAHEVVGAAQQLASRSEAQTLQIVTTSAAVDEMATSINQVSENAVLSATVAQQALSNARQGNETVKQTVHGMNRIRDQVQETAKRIKRLGESSQEIGQITQIIDDIADRTSILALNASIQAAIAGEAGRGFAVVAEEVERLADRSTDATKKIATLVKTIQSETNEAVNAMEKSILEVVEGSQRANQAGQALSEIEGISGKLADLIQAISLAAKQQARASEGVARSVNEIAEVTQDTALGTKQAAASVNTLAQLAEDLRESVSTFRLPGGDEQPPPVSPSRLAAGRAAREKVGVS